MDKDPYNFIKEYRKLRATEYPHLAEMRATSSSINRWTLSFPDKPAPGSTLYLERIGFDGRFYIWIVLGPRDYNKPQEGQLMVEVLRGYQLVYDRPIPSFQQAHPTWYSCIKSESVSDSIKLINGLWVVETSDENGERKLKVYTGSGFKVFESNIYGALN